MSTEYEVTETLDVKGESCPMPVVKAKQAIDDLDVGDVLEVLSTDPGSMSDMQGWAESTAGLELVDQSEAEGEKLFRHYLRKVA
jgi:TusA-related sulfurtransferase